MLPHQSNVRTVQSCDHGNENPFLLQHFFGHVTGIGMRNGIVHMKEFYTIKLYGVHKLAGQCQLVGLVVEKGVFRYMDLMKMDIIPQKPQAYGLFVGDKMYLMAPSGQGYAQFRGHNATPTKCRVTYNCYFHENKSKAIFVF